MTLETVWRPISITIVLAIITTMCLLPIGTALGWWLARSKAQWKDAVGAIVALPLVLPPTVLGFYLLIAMGPNGPGGWIAGLWGGRTLAFTFEGLVLGSIVYSLPFMVQPIRLAFQSVGDDALEAAQTLGAAKWQAFFRVAVPMSRAGFLTGAIMTFAHTVGEFGVVLMIGGNIPGKTKVISIAIYDFIERGHYADAHVIAAGMVAFAFAVITTTMFLGRSQKAA